MDAIKTGIKNIYVDLDGIKTKVGTVEPYEEYLIVKSPMYFDRLYTESEFNDFINNSSWYID